MLLDKYGHYFLTHLKELPFKVNLGGKNYETTTTTTVAVKMTMNYNDNNMSSH